MIIFFTIHRVFFFFLSFFWNERFINFGLFDFSCQLTHFTYYSLVFFFFFFFEIRGSLILDSLILVAY